MPKAPAVFRPPGRSGGIERKREVDADRRRAKPWRSFYGTPEWREIKAAQKAKQPLCERHLKRGEIVAMQVVNHKVRHRGDWALFLAGPFESLCKACHDGEVQREERAAGRGRR